PEARALPEGAGRRRGAHRLPDRRGGPRPDPQEHGAARPRGAPLHPRPAGARPLRPGGSMFEALKKLRYGARVLLSRSGEAQTVDLAGRPVVVFSGGDGPPLVYLHSSIGESLRWLPFHQAWARHFSVYSPLHPGLGARGGFDQVDTIEDMAFHYVGLFDALGRDEMVRGGVSVGGWIAAEFACRWPERVKKLWLCGA